MESYLFLLTALSVVWQTNKQDGRTHVDFTLLYNYDRDQKTPVCVHNEANRERLYNSFKSRGRHHLEAWVLLSHKEFRAKRVKRKKPESMNYEAWGGFSSYLQMKCAVFRLEFFLNESQNPRTNSRIDNFLSRIHSNLAFLNRINVQSASDYGGALTNQRRENRSLNKRSDICNGTCWILRIL